MKVPTTYKTIKRPTKVMDCHIQWELSKIKSADGNVCIEGWANTSDKDRVGDVVVPEAFAKSLPTYLDNPVLLFQHDWDRIIGRVEDAKIHDSKGLWVKAIISNAKDVDDVRTKILEGALKTFSIGYNEVDAVYDEQRKANFVKEVELLEISVVTIPANAGAKFTVAENTKNEAEVDVEKMDVNFAKFLAEALKELNDGEEITVEFLNEIKQVWDAQQEVKPEPTSTKSAKAPTAEEIKPKLIEFFQQNVNPTDEQMHAFAEANGIDPHELEEVVYSLLSGYISGGEKAAGGAAEVQPDQDQQMEMGIGVEQEHVETISNLIKNVMPDIDTETLNNYIVSTIENIARDHLNEMPDYYTRLAAMEGEDKGGAGSGGARAGAGRPRGQGSDKPSDGPKDTLGRTGFDTLGTQFAPAAKAIADKLGISFEEYNRYTSNFDLLEEDVSKLTGDVVGGPKLTGAKADKIDNLHSDVLDANIEFQEQLDKVSESGKVGQGPINAFNNLKQSRIKLEKAIEDNGGKVTKPRKDAPKPDHEKSLKEHEVDHLKRTTESAWKAASASMKELAASHNASAKALKCGDDHREAMKAYERCMGEVDRSVKAFEDAKSLAEAEAKASNEPKKEGDDK